MSDNESEAMEVWRNQWHEVARLAQDYEDPRLNKAVADLHGVIATALEARDAELNDLRLWKLCAEEGLAERDAKVAELEKRLEIPNAPFQAYDGIACRDETIKLQDERIERLTAKVADMQAAMVGVMRDLSRVEDTSPDADAVFAAKRALKPFLPKPAEPDRLVEFRRMTTPDPATITKDAARYRWLRDHSCPPHNFYISVPDEFHGVRYTPAEVDAYIDAARAHLENTHDAG